MTARPITDSKLAETEAWLAAEEAKIDPARHAAILAEYEALRRKRRKRRKRDEAGPSGYWWRRD
jgi:hypothetical protein